MLDLVDDVLRGLVGKSLKTKQVVLTQLVNVSNILDQAFLRELRNERVSHAVDIHHAAGGKMTDGFMELGRAIGIYAAIINLTLGANHFCPTHRTLLRHHEFLSTARVIL